MGVQQKLTVSNKLVEPRALERPMKPLGTTHSPRFIPYTLLQAQARELDVMKLGQRTLVLNAFLI
jgi:hypothetical protein